MHSPFLLWMEWCLTLMCTHENKKKIKRFSDLYIIINALVAFV